MRPISVWITLIFISRITSCKECTKEKPDDLTKIIFDLEEDFQYHLNDKNNLSDYRLDIKYSWNITAHGIDFDGILYQITDRDHSSVNSHKTRKSKMFIFKSFAHVKSSSTKDCSNLTKPLWTLNETGSSVKCFIPCRKYLSPPCYNSDLCSKLKKGYVSLPKDQRNLVLPAKFGRVYDVHFIVYRGWYVGEPTDHNVNRLSGGEARYCREELIGKQKINPGKAEEFCQKEQTIADHSFSTGPPSQIEEYKVVKDLETNRGKITFRWRAPYDISSNVTLSEFLIRPHRGQTSENKISAVLNNTQFYEAEVRDVVFGVPNSILITPTVTTGTCRDCSGHGLAFNKSFIIPDIDACIGENETERYCDTNANCTDLPNTNTTAAICQCMSGYEGDGISTIWEGTGCYDYDACKGRDSIHHICDPHAECHDSLPPSLNATCSCPSGYVGNGYNAGSGCTRISLIVGLSVAIPLIVVTVILLFVAIFKFNLTKKRAIERTLSKFIVSKESHQHALTTVSSSLAHSNGNGIHHISNEGIFGEHWELDRSKIRLEGVIGRGNFGVVKKGFLEVDERVVAVKMLTDHRSRVQNEEFLSEISLLTALGSHENLMGVIGCCTCGDDPVYLVSEYMKYGDLLHFLWDAREEEKRASDSTYELTELSMYQIGRQVASGMKYLTDTKIIHGDLAARNVLVGEGLTCRISDFGLANDVYRYGMIKGATEKRVPIKWVSPERMMSGKVPITWRSDVWSFGILLYECITLGSSPYPGIPKGNVFETLKSGYRMERPSSCSSHMYDVMKRCWEWTPSKRPTFKQLENIMRTQESKNYSNVSLAPIANTLDVGTYNIEVTNQNDETSGAANDIPVTLVETNGTIATSNGNALIISVETV